MGSAPLNAVIFAANDYSRRHLKDANMSDTQKQFLSGCFAGLCSLTIVLPFDLLKVKAQASKEKVKYRELLPRVLKEEGLRGLYKGLHPTFYRDVPTFGIYFWVNEQLQNLFS
jgi:solute carrier family 25 2-oxodicarboxylate transporter 21